MILLDTHVWIFLVDGASEEISASAHAAIESAEELFISPFSCWEVAMLAKKERLVLGFATEKWIDNALKFPHLKLAGLSTEILVKSVEIETLHPDPADRIIATTALVNNYPLVTKDRRLRDWSDIKTIW